MEGSRSKSPDQFDHVINNELSITIRRHYCYLCCKYFNDSDTFNHHHGQNDGHPSNMYNEYPSNLIDTSIWRYEIIPEGDDDVEMHDDTTIEFRKLEKQQQQPKFDVNQHQGHQECYPLKEKGKEGQIKVQCLVCSKIFTDWNSLLYHLKRKRMEEATENQQQQLPTNSSIATGLINNNSIAGLNTNNNPIILLQVMQPPIIVMNDLMLQPSQLNPAVLPGVSQTGVSNNNQDIVVDKKLAKKKDKIVVADAANDDANDEKDDDFDPDYDAQNSSTSDDEDADDDYKHDEENSSSMYIHNNDSSDRRNKMPVQTIRVMRDPSESKFVCSCGETFASRPTLKEHAQQLGHNVPEERVFCAKCPVCPESKVYTKRYLLLKHMQMDHNGEDKLYKCTIMEDCQKSFWRSADLRRHIFRVHKIQEIYECTKCQQSFTRLKRFRVHMQSHRRQNKEEVQKIPKIIEWTCPYCTPVAATAIDEEGQNVDNNVVFKTKKEVIDHCRTRHPGQRLYKCTFYPDCDKTYWTKANLNEHLLVSHEEDDSKYPHKCTFDPSSCTKKFVHAHQLTVHLRTHSGDLPFLCTRCGARFHDNKTYHAHMKAHDDRFECPTCHKIFNTTPNLNRHVKRQHLGLKEFLCSMCPMTFGQKVGLDAHMFTRHQTGDPKFVCECGKKYLVKSLYTNHITNCRSRNRVQDEERGQTVFPCTFEGCSRTFPNSIGRRVHMDKIHSAELETTPCPECGKVFLGPQRLRMHITKIHRKDMGKFLCSLCGKALASSSNLNAHMKYHKKFPPGSVYKCDICSKDFTDQRFLTRHIRISHKSDEN